MAILNILVIVCLLYVVLLFAVAYGADRAAKHGRGTWLSSPWIYTLSLSVYCTAWTFYGAVGFAARSGLEFITIYLGPTLVMIGWWGMLRKMVRVGQAQRITSIADLISSRFGKSNTLAVFVTVIAVIGTTPYIALQLQSVTLSFASFAEADPENTQELNQTSTAFWIALGLSLFTIIFGTRNLDANERHYGVVMAIALEAVVKLFALLAVGVFVVWGLSDGLSETLTRIDQSEIANWEVTGSRWIGLTFLSAAAFICLPRMFQVMVVENEDDGHLRTASWAFPTYLMLMSLFVVPIAVVGLDLLPEGSNPDLFVLTLPLYDGREGLAMLSFLGGFSSATSMVIVAAIATSTMVSNHIVMPIWLRYTGGSAMVSGDVRQIALLARRLSIGGIVFLGYLYFRISGGGAALAAIGLVSFAGVAQFLPALLGGLFWRGATRLGALSGLGIGFIIWLYTMFLPSFGASAIIPHAVFENGLLGLMWLRPQALFGVAGLDPVIHALMWSMTLNTTAFVIVSLVTIPKPMERLQSAQFVDVYSHSAPTGSWKGGIARSDDLLIMAQRIMGPKHAQQLFAKAAVDQGLQGSLPEATPSFLQQLERELSGSVGAATAHAMISQITGGATVSVQELMAVADETAQIMEYSQQLETQSKELSRTALQLRQANEKLTELSMQKDAFLSQISHELRTPMSSIRAFSGILRDEQKIDPKERDRFSSIIHDEATRLTRLLDDLLDLNVLENGNVKLNLQKSTLGDLLERAETAATGGINTALEIKRNLQADKMPLHTDLDRLGQVFINLINNTVKYADVEKPIINIQASRTTQALEIDVSDNGPGIPEIYHNKVFEKFAQRSKSQSNKGGAGLGLAICHEIMRQLGGSITYVPQAKGAAYKIKLPINL